jgi:hypothetical protein
MTTTFQNRGLDEEAVGPAIKNGPREQAGKSHACGFLGLHIGSEAGTRFHFCSQGR